eukprot:1006079-Rhodomonas_salina.2
MLRAVSDSTPRTNRHGNLFDLRRCRSSQVVLGRGSTSVVLKCTDVSTGEAVAVKGPRSPNVREACRSSAGKKDAQMLEELRHENIVEHRKGCSDGSMVMEYLDGGSLLDVMARAGGSLDEDDVADLTRQILSGLMYMHEKGILHRDIKPANIFFDSATSTAKIGDIATASEENSSKRTKGVKTPVGTPAFLAPEVVRGGDHVEESDIWALGCSVLQLLTGKLPWHEEDSSFSAMFKIGSGQHPPLPPSSSSSSPSFDNVVLSERAAHFLKACFLPVEQRPSAQLLLSHPFLALRPPSGPRMYEAWLRRNR